MLPAECLLAGHSCCIFIWFSLDSDHRKAELAATIRVMTAGDGDILKLILPAISTLQNVLDSWGHFCKYVDVYPFLVIHVFMSLPGAGHFNATRLSGFPIEGNFPGTGEMRCLNNLPDNKIFVVKVRVGHCTNVMYVNCE